MLRYKWKNIWAVWRILQELLILNIVSNIETMEEYKCEINDCKNTMTEEEYNFCDICPDCREDMGGLF